MADLREQRAAAGRSGKYLLWDFDGTLAHRPGMWTGAVLGVLREAQLAHGVTRDAVSPYLNSGFPWHTPEVIRPANQDADAWWQDLEPVFIRAFQSIDGIDQSRARELARYVRGTYLDADSWVVYDDARPALAALSQVGWQHVVLSNHVPELPDLMASLGLRHQFEAVHTSATTGVEKPNPEAFLRVVATLPRGSAVCMVGDSFVADVRGAAAAGLSAVLVRSSSDSEVPQCRTLTELVGTLGALAEAPATGDG